MRSQTSERTDPTTGARITTTYSQTVSLSKNGRRLTVKTTRRTITRPAPAETPERATNDDAPPPT